MGEKTSPHLRKYDSGWLKGKNKTDYSQVRSTPQDKERIKVLDNYVKYDGDLMVPLCMRSLCVKGEGHVGACRKAT